MGHGGLDVVARLAAHNDERAAGAVVLGVLAGAPAAAMPAWGQWAARAGLLTAVTEAGDEARAIAELWAKVPHLRALPRARSRIADAAALDAAALDAACRARGDGELTRWLGELLGEDDVSQVAAWLVAHARSARLGAPPLSARAALLALCELAAPMALLWVPPPAAGAAWLSAALRSAGALALAAPRLPIAVVAEPSALAVVAADLGASALASLVRTGTIEVSQREAPPDTSRARSRTEAALFSALARDPRTRAKFELNARVPVRGALAEVDLYAAGARLAVEVDGWYHFRDLDAYRRDRTKDVQLQEAGHFVMRFCAEDVEARLELTVEHIACVLEHRLAARTQQGATR